MKRKEVFILVLFIFVLIILILSLSFYIINNKILCNYFKISCDKNLKGELGSSNPLASEESCRDGIDNDNDGKIDYPNDAGCMDVDDDNEAGEPYGYLDGVNNCQNVYGWTCDPDDFNQGVDVHLYKDGPVGAGGVLLGIVKADVQRESAVGGLCGGNVNHGFSFDIPVDIKDGNDHSIYAYAINIGTPANNAVLNNVPLSFNCNNPSVIINSGRKDLIGKLQLILQRKSSSGDWENYRAITNRLIMMNSNDKFSIALDQEKGWNNKNVIALISGDYRVLVSLEFKNKKFEVFREILVADVEGFTIPYYYYTGDYINSVYDSLVSLYDTKDKNKLSEVKDNDIILLLGTSKDIFNVGEPIYLSDYKECSADVDCDNGTFCRVGICRKISDLLYPKIDNYKIKGLTTSADFWPDKDEIINNYAGRMAVNLKWNEWEPFVKLPPCDIFEYEYDNHCFVINDKLYRNILNRDRLNRDILEWSHRGLVVTGVIYGVPNWARINDCSLVEGRVIFCAPKNSEDYGRFAGMLAERYNGLNFNGRISDFVIHNEVNVNQWFDVGCGQGEPCDKDYWINEYSNNYISAYDKIKSEQPEAKVLISLDHQFDTSFDKLNDYDPTISGKTFLIEFSKKVGDRKWQVAFHPYPKNIFSNEISFNDMPYVTFGNIGMLVGWLRQNFPDNPSSWNVQITEAGINSLTPSSPEKQASTLCDAFRNILATPKIESFLYHRMKDHPDETVNGLGLGLRNSDSSAKPAWVTWALANRKDVNILSCGFEDLPYTRLKRGYNSNKGHIVSSRILPNDFNIEWNDVGLLRDEVSDSVLLYECLIGQHTLITKDSNCEGLTPMGPVGYILQTQKLNTIPIWRCSINNGADHIVSKYENCEGQQKELLLGYGYKI